jgi:hypothetical protein
MWLMSLATPGVPAMSYKDRSVTKGLSFIRSPRGCPIPPAAPSTATLRLAVADDMHRTCCCLGAEDNARFTKPAAADRAAIVELRRDLTQEWSVSAAEVKRRARRFGMRMGIGDSGTFTASPTEPRF